MILAKLNNVVLEGMDGWRLQKVGVVNHSVKWCVVSPSSLSRIHVSGSPRATASLVRTNGGGDYKKS